jgi:phospholipase/carboxylesterase
VTDYIYKAGNPALTPLLLLHSTGGDEAQLLPIAQEIAPEHPILSLRGRISDGGVNRYFKLRGQGFTKANFDLESLAIESKWLAGEILTLSEQHGIDSNKMTAVGYSNGANVALYMALNGLFSFDRIIAFHSMQLTESEAVHRVASRVFLTHADNDPIVSADNFNALVADLEKANCKPNIFKSDQGHQLTEAELRAAREWLATDK